VDVRLSRQDPLNADSLPIVGDLLTMAGRWRVDHPRNAEGPLIVADLWNAVDLLPVDHLRSQCELSARRVVGLSDPNARNQRLKPNA
jgi:hypothetical protein